MKNIVVTFHNVRNAMWFEKTLDTLSRFYQFRGLNLLEDTFDKKTDTRGYCFITFDDGEKSFYEIAYPVLLKRKIHATIFVSPKAIMEEKNFWFQNLQDVSETDIKDILKEKGFYDPKLVNSYDSIVLLKSLCIESIEHIVSAYYKKNNKKMPGYQNISQRELLEISSSGLILIGAHTMSHPILLNESDEISLNEIKQSIEQLATLIQKEIRYFAYPNGFFGLDFSNREVSFLQSTTVHLAFSSDPGKIMISESKYRINRIGLTVGSMPHVLAKVFIGNVWDSAKSFLKGNKNEVRQRLSLRKLIHNK